jgi:hypothetical protein
MHCLRLAGSIGEICNGLTAEKAEKKQRAAEAIY